MKKSKKKPSYDAGDKGLLAFSKRRAKHDLSAVAYGIRQLMHDPSHSLHASHPTLYFAMEYWAGYAERCEANFEKNVREETAEDQGE